jgi:DNA polymerase IV
MSVGRNKVRRIMHLDLDVFFVAVERLRRPELIGKPVIVGGKSEHRGVVSTASYEARAFGVHSGLPMVTARRLCPNGYYVDSHFGDYVGYSRKFMAILADFSPFMETGGLDEAYLDVTGFESLHCTIAAMAEAIREKVRRELGLAVSVGIGSNKLVAKVASDAAKPDGVLEIAAGDEAAFLSPMAIGKLPGIGKKTAPLLHRLGINTLGELAGIPPGNLKDYFGSAGEVMQRHARGLGNDTITPPGVVKSISKETTFHQDIASANHLRATLYYLSEKVARKLRQHNLQAKTVAIKIRYSDFSTITRQVSLPRPCSSDRIIGDVAQKLLEKELSGKLVALRLIGVRVANLGDVSTQLDMLDGAPAEQRHIEAVMDRIRDRYGFDAIRSGRTIKAGDGIYQWAEKGDR